MTDGGKALTRFRSPSSTKLLTRVLEHPAQPGLDRVLAELELRTPARNSRKDLAAATFDENEGVRE